jgi:hypothetical protein
VIRWRINSCVGVLNLVARVMSRRQRRRWSPPCHAAGIFYDVRTATDGAVQACAIGWQVLAPLRPLRHLLLADAGEPFGLRAI